MSPKSEMHERRALTHVAAGASLAESASEWAAVCYFYAAFHAVRVALLQDMRLRTLEAAQKVDPNLKPAAKYVTFHNAHPLRGMGVNQLVKVLYPEIGSEYGLLHIRSVEVRYDDGITAGGISDTEGLMHIVLDALRARNLIRF